MKMNTEMSHRNLFIIILAIILPLGLNAVTTKDYQKKIIGEITIGNYTIDINAMEDNSLVSFFVHENEQSVGNRIIIENKRKSVSVLYINIDDKAFMAIDGTLVICEISKKTFIVIPNWYAASMYLYGNMLYAELAHAEPYGEGIDINSLIRTDVYKKQRPFDISIAILAREVKAE